MSMLMTRRPDDLKMIMIDPKVVELSEYGKIPHLMHPVVSDMKKAEAILAWAVDKMEERYDLLGRARVRNIAAYNELAPAEVLHPRTSGTISPVTETPTRQSASRWFMPLLLVAVCRGEMPAGTGRALRRQVRHGCRCLPGR